MAPLAAVAVQRNYILLLEGRVSQSLITLKVGLKRNKLNEESNLVQAAATQREPLEDETQVGGLTDWLVGAQRRGEERRG